MAKHIDKLDKAIRRFRDNCDKPGVVSSPEFDWETGISEFEDRALEADSAISIQGLCLALGNSKVREPAGTKIRELLQQIMENFSVPEKLDDVEESKSTKKQQRPHICLPELLEEANKILEAFGMSNVTIVTNKGAKKPKLAVDEDAVEKKDADAGEQVAGKGAKGAKGQGRGARGGRGRGRGRGRCSASADGAVE